MPSLQSQSFSRSYGSILPTSLTYFVLSTRGYSPWRPAAVISTINTPLHPSTFHGTSRAHWTGQNRPALPLSNFLRQSNCFQKLAFASMRKENSPQNSCCIRQVHHVTITESVGPGILSTFPFDKSRKPRLSNRIDLSLRID